MSSNPNLVTTFTYKDLLLKKLIKAVTCSISSQVVVLHLCLYIACANFTKPLEWLPLAVKLASSVTNWLYFSPLILILFGQCVISAKDYVSKSTFCLTRFQKCITIFSFHNYLLINIHILIGGINVWLILYLVEGEYGSLTRNVGGKTQLVEETLLLIIGGLWTGFYYFMCRHIFGEKIIFPTVFQGKIVQFRSEIFSVMNQSIMHSLFPNFLFVVLYLLFGYQVKNEFCFLFSVTSGPSFAKTVFFYHFLFTILYYFNMKLSKLYFHLFLTEPVEFPLIPYTNQVLTLQESISLENIPIVQSLACLDLYRLSLWSRGRRQLLFTLSQPGSHPYNWNQLVQSILKLYASYVQILDAFFLRMTHQEAPKTTQIDPMHVKSHLQPEKFRNLRNMSLYSDNISITSPMYSIPLEPTLGAKFRTLVNKVVKCLRTMLAIDYFFGEISDMQINHLLSQRDLIIWSCQGLSEVIISSINEDPYGVVLKDIPVVIAGIVHLRQSVDNLNKIPALAKRISVGEDNWKIRTAISGALKRSLFNICYSYREYIEDLNLSKDVMTYLNTMILSKL